MGAQNGKITADDEGFVNLGRFPDLKEKGRAVIKHDGRQIALFETESGLYAIYNRCPHEGYPLVEGSLKKNCQLACNWHGWTFDLKSGKAIQGRDAVKTYPIERRGENIWVDLTPEPIEARRQKAFLELDEAVAEHDYSRIARSIARLDVAGVEVNELASFIINWSLPKFERGIGHAHAGLVDWLDMTDEYPAERPVALLEALGHFSYDGMYSARPATEGGKVNWNPDQLVVAIEAMDQPLALALVSAAYGAELGFDDLKPLFLKVVFNHYAGFGHPAIYIMKAEQLIGRLGEEVSKTLSLQIARYLCLAAREDLIPEFRGFSDYLKLEPGQAPVPAAENLSGQSVRHVMALTAASSAIKRDTWDALVAACALNMLHFDIEKQNGVQQPIAKNIGWLDFTHALTFAEAVHHHASGDEALWQSGLMQLACFVGRNKPFLGEEDIKVWKVDDPDKFLQTHKTRLFDMDEGEYIFAVHRLKMILACEKLVGLVKAETGELVLAALNRYLSSPLRKRHAARTAFQAYETVQREG
ncbi:Rieske (2Fe-2S) protein [Kordiimonas sp.]|uniref:Rieske (2Fe-2S) protein n=1 Tax=Kordiimonas sp. TaxID=1970157 RepID=UPI003A9353F5